MDLLFLICYISTLRAVSGYVLLAANLDDFRTLAKKFVPKNVAEDIIEMVQHSGMNHNPIKARNTGGYSAERHLSYQENLYDVERDKRETSPREEPRFEMKSAVSAPDRSQDSHIDEIVEKVKQRLMAELLDIKTQTATKTNEKLADRIVSPANPVKEDREENEYDGDDNVGKERQHPFKKIQSHFQSNVPKMKRIDRNKQVLPQNNLNPYLDGINLVTGQEYVKTSHIRQEYIIDSPKQSQQQRISKPKLKQRNRIAKKRKVKNKQLTTESINDDILEAVDLEKSNDSYEDYVIPAKEEPLESDVVEEESSRYKPLVITLNPKATARTTTEAAIALAEDVAGYPEDDEYDKETTDATMEVKAKGEDINFDDDDEIGTRKSETETKSVPGTAEVKRKVTNKIKIATMMPTRERYKLSSPNYYAQLPTVAERYNFNEPIPERDQEPENLKSFGNPPAHINGKIRLLK